MKKRIFALILCLFIGLCFLANPVFSAPVRYRVGHEPVAMMADGVLARPLGLASTVIGSAFFIVTLPFTIPSGSVGSAKRQMIDYPAWFTFKRPLGEFGTRYERPIIKKSHRPVAVDETESTLERTKQTDKDVSKN